MRNALPHRGGAGIFCIDVNRRKIACDARELIHVKLGNRLGELDLIANAYIEVIHSVGVVGDREAAG